MAGYGNKAPAFAHAEAHRLYKELLGPLESRLQGKLHLVVATSGALAQLPKAVLTRSPNAASSPAESSWLIKDLAISHVPTANGWLSLKKLGEQASSPQALMAWGDSAFDPKAMGHAINACKLIQQAVGGLVLLVHHSGKDATKGMRGHSSLHAALDAAIEVKRSGDEREWSVAKAKDGADGKGHPFMLEVVDMGADEDGDPITSCLIRPSAGAGLRVKPLTQIQQVGMDAFMAAALANIGGADQSVHAGLEQWRDEFYRRSTADNTDSKARSFHRLRAALIDLGKLTNVGDVYRLPNGFPNQTA